MLSDDELDKRCEAAYEHSRETWKTVLAGVYLVFLAPTLPVMLLIRAAERSSALEVGLWLAGAALAGVAALVWRKFNSHKALWHEALAERQRRRG